MPSIKYSIYILILFLNIHGNLHAKDEINFRRVEPAFWWANMESDTLQITAIGKNISSARVEVNADGIRIEKVLTGQNSDYLFIYLIISDDVNPTSFSLRFFNENELVSNYNYELRSNPMLRDRHTGLDKNSIIYTILPDRFYDGNEQNNNITNKLEFLDRTNPSGVHGGDFSGITSQLDYIRTLGFNCIKLSPFLDSDMPRHSYGGYAVTDYYKVNPFLGTNEELLNLVENYQNNGIKVVMEYPISNCGSENWIVKDQPVYDWVIEAIESPLDPTKLLPTLTDPHAAEYDKNVLYKNSLNNRLVNLNHDNEILRTYITQNLIFWIMYTGIDGVKLLNIPFGKTSNLKRMVTKVKAQFPELSILGDFKSDTPSQNGYWQTNEDSGINHLYDSPFREASLKAFDNDPFDETDGLVRLYNVISKDFSYKEPNSNIIRVDDLFSRRVFTYFREDLSKWKMTMALLFTMRGIPEITYGTEILMQGHEKKGLGYVREPFPGGFGENKLANLGMDTALTSGQKEAMEFIKILAEWRTGTDIIKPLSEGSLTHYYPLNNVYVYFRTDRLYNLMIIFNNNTRETVLYTDRFEKSMHNYKIGTDILTGKNFENIKNIKIPPKSVMILDLEK